MNTNVTKWSPCTFGSEEDNRHEKLPHRWYSTFHKAFTSVQWFLKKIWISQNIWASSIFTRSPYCLTKYALEGFHDVLRYEMRAFGVNVSISKFVKFICLKRNFKSRNPLDLSLFRWAFLSQGTLLLEPISSTKPLSIVKCVVDHYLVTSSSNLILWGLNVGPTIILISIMLIMNWIQFFQGWVDVGVDGRGGEDDLWKKLLRPKSKTKTIFWPKSRTKTL